MTLADITKLLPTLTSDELLKLRMQINALLQISGEMPMPRNVAADPTPNRMAIECISEVLRDLGVDHVSPATLMHMRVPSFASKVSDVMQFLERALLTQTERRAMLCLGLKLLHHDLTQNNVPVSGKTMMNHFHRIPGVIDNAFPGYAAHGLLHATISRTLTAPGI